MVPIREWIAAVRFTRCPGVLLADGVECFDRVDRQFQVGFGDVRAQMGSAPVAQSTIPSTTDDTRRQVVTATPHVMRSRGASHPLGAR
jgi:hypothetical protein